MQIPEFLREVNMVSVLLRIALSLAVGGILGMERGRRNRPAGFRTYMLVCLGSALVMMTNQYVFQYYGVSDPVRMGAQVISGIGFLGVGTIVVTGKSQVKGITTAAGLWAAACCGLAIGVGFYEGAVAGGITIFVVMALMQRFDATIRKNSKSMELYIEFENSAAFGDFLETARQCSVDVYDIQIQKNKMVKDLYTIVILTAQSRVKRSHTEVIEMLSEAPGVHYIEELQ